MIIIGFVIIISNFFIYNRYIKYEYTLEIDSQGPFIVEVPFPLNFDSHMETIFDKIEILKGNCSLEINNSIYGISLIIKGENYVKIRSKVEDVGEVSKDLDFMELSMMDYDNFTKDSDERVLRDAWFYSNNNSSKVEFSFKYRNGLHRGHLFKSYWGSFGEWRYKGQLEGGWQQLKLRGFDAEA